MAKQIIVNKFYLGNTLISDLKFGGVDVDRVYKQGEIVFDRGEVSEGTDFMFYMTFDGEKPIQGGWYFNGEAIDITNYNHDASGDYSAWKVSLSSPTQIHATSGYIMKYGMYGREFEVDEDPTDEYYTGKLTYILTWRPSDDSQDYEIVTIASGTIDNYIASDRYEFDFPEEYRYTYGVYRFTVSVEDSDTGGGTPEPDPEPEPEQYKAGSCINNTASTLQLYWQDTGGSEHFEDWEPGEMDFYLDVGVTLLQFGLTYQLYSDGSEQDDHYYHGDLYYKLYGIDESSDKETVVWSGFQENYNFKIPILTGINVLEDYDQFRFVCSSTEISDPDDDEPDPDVEPEPEPD